ncbi:hypothetical protein Tco_0267454 [Tanacetum coccineum]
METIIVKIYIRCLERSLVGIVQLLQMLLDARIDICPVLGLHMRLQVKLRLQSYTTKQRQSYRVEGFHLPNHDTGRILPAKSQRNITNPLVAGTDSSSTEYDSADESSVRSTPLPPLEKLNGIEPISGQKTIKSILRSKSTFKLEALKGVIINAPSSAPAKGNKSSSASKVHSSPAGKLKSVKIEDDPPLAIVMKELNNLKLQVSRNQSSYSRSNQSQQVEGEFEVEKVKYLEYE